MPAIALYALRIVHFVGMALWFAAAATIGSDIKRTLTRGKPHTEVLVQRVSRALAFQTLGGLLTVASGLGMIFGQGGFGAVRPTIHAGFGLALIALAVELLVLKPAVARLGEALEAGDAKAKSAPGRIAMLSGIGHLLKLVILVLMVFRAS